MDLEQFKSEAIAIGKALTIRVFTVEKSTLSLEQAKNRTQVTLGRIGSSDSKPAHSTGSPSLLLGLVIAIKFRVAPP